MQDPGTRGIKVDYKPEELIDYSISLEDMISWLRDECKNSTEKYSLYELEKMLQQAYEKYCSYLDARQKVFNQINNFKKGV